MPKVPINDPKLWRERAEEARTVGDQLTDPDAKRRMLRSPMTTTSWRGVPKSGCTNAKTPRHNQTDPLLHCGISIWPMTVVGQYATSRQRDGMLRDKPGSAAAPAARCRNLRRGSFI